MPLYLDFATALYTFKKNQLRFPWLSWRPVRKPGPTLSDIVYTALPQWGTVGSRICAERLHLPESKGTLTFLLVGTLHPLKLRRRGQVRKSVRLSCWRANAAKNSPTRAQPRYVLACETMAIQWCKKPPSTKWGRNYAAVKLHWRNILLCIIETHWGLDELRHFLLLCVHNSCIRSRRDSSEWVLHRDYSSLLIFRHYAQNAAKGRLRIREERLRALKRNNTHLMITFIIPCHRRPDICVRKGCRLIFTAPTM